MSVKSAATPRASSNLTVSFGLVNVEVSLGNLIEPDPGIKGKTVCRTHQEQVKRRWWCEKGDHDCTEESESVFDVEGKLVHLDTDELKSERDGIIHLDTFIPVEKIDPLYYEQTYLVWPRGSSQEGYDLLADALRDTGKVALGTCVISKNTRLFVLRFSERTGTLLAHVCSYDQNVRWHNAELVSGARNERPIAKKQLAEMAIQLLNSLDDEFHPEKYHDDYQERLHNALVAAAKGKKAPAKPKKTIKPDNGDLLEALKASVEAASAKKKTSKKEKISV